METKPGTRFMQRISLKHQRKETKIEKEATNEKKPNQTTIILKHKEYKVNNQNSE